MNARVLKGSKNVFLVKLEAERAGSDTLLSCAFKGKVLKSDEEYYNPLAPGDMVTVEEISGHPGAGRITGLVSRRTAFIRYNQKERLPQILAANVDIVVCVTTPASPPFRPRFIDRVLVEAEAAGLAVCIVLNKHDLAEEDGGGDSEDRLADFRRLGYPVFVTSAVTCEGLAALSGILAGKLAVLTGQSGVGKSSIINALWPNAARKTGALNEKFDRGSHTTAQAGLIEFETAAGHIRLVDTPGVRQFIPWGVNADNVQLAFREIAPLAGRCAFGLSCAHETEPRCAVRDALARGIIHPDRYESFLRLRAGLRASVPRKNKSS